MVAIETGNRQIPQMKRMLHERLPRENVLYWFGVRNIYQGALAVAAFMGLLFLEKVSKVFAEEFASNSGFFILIVLVQIHPQIVRAFGIASLPAIKFSRCTTIKVLQEFERARLVLLTPWHPSPYLASNASISAGLLTLKYVIAGQPG